MKRTLIVTACLLCFAAGALLSQLAVPSAEAQKRRGPSQWQYQCVGANAIGEVTERSNRLGAQGWNLTSAANTKDGPTWCFKRPLWKN